MGLKSYRPLTPTLRYKQIGDRKEITAEKPYKPLTEGIKSSSGRNNAGEITSRRRGGGHKKLYRIIDFKRQFAGIPCTVETIEYDPNRTARIALVKYQNGKLGTVEASKDGLLAICVKGAAVSTTFAQNKAYKIYQPSGLTALGVTATSHPLLVEAVRQFYNEAEEGTPVYVVAYSDDSMSDFLDKDEGSLKGILQSVKGDIRGVVVYHAGTEDPDTSEGLEADVFTASSCRFRAL